MKKEIPILLGLSVGMLLIIATFFPSEWLSMVKTEIDQWFLIVTAFAIVMGMINLYRVHSKEIRQNKDGKSYSIVLLVCMFGIVVFGMAEGGVGTASFQRMYQLTIAPMTATMPAVLAFHITSSAYRAFRARSLEATLLLSTAIIVMLGNIAVGDAISPAVPKVATWILDVPNTGAMRGITMAAALGAIATALRTLIGAERSHLGGTSDS